MESSGPNSPSFKARVAPEALKGDETIANQVRANQFAESTVKPHCNLFDQITRFANRVA